MQCKVYDSLLALSPDLQAARGLMCCSVALTGLGLLIAIAGMRCTACIQGNDRAKRMILIIAGCMILAGCFCCIIPISWTGHAIIQDFYNPLLIDAQRRELGEALYIGWVSSAFLFAGGCIFTCCNCPLDKGPDPRYMYTRNAPYVAYQPQPVAYHPQPHSVYSHPSGPPSFIEQSYQPSRQQSFIQPSRQQSFIQPSRHPSARSAVAYLWNPAGRFTGLCVCVCVRDRWKGRTSNQKFLKRIFEKKKKSKLVLHFFFFFPVSFLGMFLATFRCYFYSYLCRSIWQMERTSNQSLFLHKVKNTIWKYLNGFKCNKLGPTFIFFLFHSWECFWKPFLIWLFKCLSRSKRGKDGLLVLQKENLVKKKKDFKCN